MAVALAAIGLVAIAGVVVGRSGGSVAQEATPAPEAVAGPRSVVGESADPVARGGRLAVDDAATPPSAVPGVTEPPVPEVVKAPDEPVPTRPATASTSAVPPEPAPEPAATEDAEPARCGEGRGAARARDAAASQRGGAACR
ncbi:hypothetical protein ACI784_11355 [Geodermatophilus sp. SYSU D01186]